MRFLIVTGMSGAGKSNVVRILEDVGYYCIDNMPAKLMSKFFALCLNSQLNMDKIAFVVDARSGESITLLADELGEFRRMGNSCEVLFLEASDAVLIKRYKETRRVHPHAQDGRLEDGINRERMLLSNIRSQADYIIDTSGLLPRQLRDQIMDIFVDGKQFENININVVSFGYKYGIPLDADLVFDVRFLPNPYYDPDMRDLTGLDAPVREYVMKWWQTEEFIKKLHSMILFLLPYYVEEGKPQLVIGIGCTGGRHRSVTVAEELGKFLTQNNYHAVVSHRDIKK